MKGSVTPDSQRLFVIKMHFHPIQLPMETQSENDDDPKNLMENERLKKLTMEIQCQTDDERKYLLLIEKQKLEREQVIRQKEMKRKLEVISICR